MKRFCYLGVLYTLLATKAIAVDKFEILPDLPDVANGLIPTAQAGSVTNNIDISGLGINSVGQEPSAISVVFSLLIVILLIYVTGILYAKFNKLGMNNFNKGQRNNLKSQVLVESTISLGNNKTLHVVELDGKRMLIGASSNSIQLIKDLGNSSLEQVYTDNYSHIEIPNIKIPKIEIPKIEIPFVNFSKLATKTHKPIEQIEEEFSKENHSDADFNSIKNNLDKTFENDKIIDSLFKENKQINSTEDDDNIEEFEKNEDLVFEHSINPEDFELHKKYLK